MRRIAASLLVLSAACAVRSPRLPEATNPVDRLVPQRAERAIDTLLASFDRTEAMGHVEFMSPFWRLAGNDGFDMSIDRLEGRLLGAGFVVDIRHTPADGPGAAPARVLSYANSGHGWDHSAGTLALVHADGTETVVLSKEQDRLALCINSFSTPGGGRVLRLVDVGGGEKAADYDGKDLRDALVVGDAGPGVLWTHAMSLGAAGVVSTALP
ncbi:MAG: hypothetical protein M3Q55_12145, partial [Acidobacteriota bacterium]|nr:hypothetical protein [Acidobacteriota bacterium]